MRADDLIWTSQHLAQCHKDIEEWGKPQVFGAQSVDSDWLYAWACWCGEGWARETWDVAMEDLELHLLMGFHK